MKCFTSMYPFYFAVKMAGGSAVGAQWFTECLTRDRRFKSHRRHCVLSLSTTHISLLSTGSAQEDPSKHNWKIVDWDVKNQIKQTSNWQEMYKIWNLCKIAQVSYFVHLVNRKPTVGIIYKCFLKLHRVSYFVQHRSLKASCGHNLQMFLKLHRVSYFVHFMWLKTNCGHNLQMFMELHRVSYFVQHHSLKASCGHNLQMFWNIFCTTSFSKSQLWA